MAQSTVIQGFQFTRWFITAIPIVAFSFFVIKALADTKTETVYHAEYVHKSDANSEGYSTPANYDVNASPHKKMSDYLGGSWAIALICFVIAAAGPNIYISVVNKNAGSPAFPWILLFWLVGIIGVIVGYAVMTGSTHYSINLNTDQFNAAKDSLDNLFPRP